MTNLLTLNKWHDYYYKLDNKYLSEHHIISALTSLFKMFDNLSLDTIILIQFKIKFDNNQFRSVSYLQTVRLTEFKELLEVFIKLWNLKDQDYISLNPSHIVFTYKILSTDNEIIKTSKLNRSKSIKDNTKTFNFKGYNLPCTMDFSNWGTLIFESDTFAQVKKLNSNSIYHINIFEKELKVNLKIKDKTILEFTDKILEKGKLNSFIRRIKNQEYIFIDGNSTIKKIKKSTTFLKPIHPQGFFSTHFLTMDLETRTIDSRMSPYSLSIYDGKITTSFYLLNYINSDELLKSAIRFVMRPKYHNYKVYLHNFSFFDGIFLLKVLSELTDIKIKPKVRDGRIIDLKFPFYIFNNKINLYFRDSYLLLPSSLSKLALNFKVSNKGIFPYKFVNNKDIPLDYIGEIPKHKYFDNLSLQDYNNYCNSFENKS
jgi:hypothetical protein